MIQLQDLKALLPELEENYKHLHQHPELGFEEQLTSAFILKKLQNYGITDVRQVARTGLIATIHGTTLGKTIAIRADMDALPIEEQCDLPYCSKYSGKMHACGHDAHVSMLLCAAKYFSSHRSELKGNIRLIFQPAEEGASSEMIAAVVAEGGSAQGGAASMIAFGALEDVDACFALHVNASTPVGTFGITQDRATASSDVFELTIQGKGGHGSAPESAVDPMGALAAIISAFNGLPAREFSALDSCCLSIGALKAGQAWNVIPDSVYMTGGLRAFSDKTRDEVFQRLSELAEGICTAHRCTAIFSRNKGYAPTINAPEIALEMLRIAKDLFGEDNAVLIKQPLMGSEDVGYYFQKVPGAIGWLGAMPSSGPVSQHNPSFKIALETLHLGTLFHINMALDYLNQSI